MARGADTVTVAQTGLIATVIQMLILLICGGLVLLGHVPVGSSFIYWLMAVYIISMIAIIASINGVIRATSTSKA
jgi:phosphatidylglycerophosphate synthase